MGSEMGLNVASMPSPKIPQSHPKVMLLGKRGGEYLDQDSDSSNKRPKMRDLLSVLQCEGINNHDSATSKMEGTEQYPVVVDTQCSQSVDNSTVEYLDASDSERLSRKSSTLRVDHIGSKLLDLNDELCTDGNSSYSYAIEPIQGAGSNSSYVKQKSHNNVKTRFSLECGKSTGHSEDREGLRRWKEMKQNGFVSASYGGIPTAPKPRGRKRKNDVLQQKMEKAKKEQVDRFAIIAAPSGLLNGLNPGIINHVRNSKQVRSIINTLVKSEIKESQRQASELKVKTEGTNEQESTSFSGMNGSSLSYDFPSFGSASERNLTGEPYFSNDSEGRLDEKPYLPSHPKNNCEDDMLALKLSLSSTAISESTSCVSNGESKIVDSVDVLSVKAGTVASQWLQLEQQDIRGRLEALHLSKKRVHAVITTELPFLLSKEFPSNRENELYITKDCETTELHRAKWTKFFTEMDSALSEEEKRLETWLEQVNRMQIHCDQGLKHVMWNTLFDNNKLRSKANDQEKELSVRAAAASIYSTCNYQSSKNNVIYC